MTVAIAHMNAFVCNGNGVFC